jgi:hypothetical protein
MLRERERVTEPLLKEKQAEVSAAPVSRPPETRASFSATNHDAAPECADLGNRPEKPDSSRDDSPGEGWRWVEPHEPLERGDQCWSNEGRGWLPVTYYGDEWQITRQFFYRRRINSHANHDAAPAARAPTDASPLRSGSGVTAGMGTGDTQEPVAWAVMLAGDERIYDVYAIEEDAKAIDEAVTGNHGIVPLYRSPTLTDEEREAIELAAYDYLYHQDPGGRAQWIREQLLGLLARTGGTNG